MILIALVFIIAVALRLSAEWWANQIDDIPEEYERCQGCTSGWCTAVPDDDECKEWRHKNEQGLQGSERDKDATMREKE